VGTGEAPAAATPGSPSALHPPAAAPARLMRHEQEEAPRKRRGHPGGRGKGSGAAGQQPSREHGEVPRAKERRGLGVGSGYLYPCPHRLPPAARPAPAAVGAAGRPQWALLLSHEGSRLTLSHTHAHTHSLTHSLPYTQQKGSAAQQPVPPQREEEGKLPRNTAAPVAKTSRSFELPPAVLPAGSCGSWPPLLAPAPQGPREASGEPLPRRQPNTPRGPAPSEAGSGLQGPACVSGSCCPPSFHVSARHDGTVEHCIMGLVVHVATSFGRLAFFPPMAISLQSGLDDKNLTKEIYI
jgi:hypothetical protein